MKRRIRHTLTSAFIALVAWSGSAGCHWRAPESRQVADLEAMDRKALEVECAKLHQQAGQLRAQLAARELDLAKSRAQLETESEMHRLLQAELEATTADLDYVESQFITLERGLKRNETRATAVAAIADAQLVQKRLRDDQPGVIPQPVWAEVDERMAAAEASIAEEHFTAAVYYAHRALRLMTRTERSRSAFFATGVARVVSVTSANLRAGPGPRHDVLGQLAYGTILVELTAVEDWRRVKTRDGAEGWIHHTLIR